MMSPFEDAFADLRVSGSVLLNGVHAAPWAVDVPSEEGLRRILNAGARQRAIPFHLVRRGRFELITSSGTCVDVSSGEVVLCPSGQAHRMRLGATAKPIPFESIFRGEARIPAWAGEEDMTELVCGVFLLSAAPLNPLLGALPPVLICATAGPNANPMLVHATEMLVLEVQGPEQRIGSYTCARLLEIFCAEIIRAHKLDPAAGKAGWFRGLEDPKIAKALARVHADPAANWSVESLAAVAVLSPSRFAARFRDSMGETVMTYVTRWRMNLACRHLRDSETSIESVAARIGYSGGAAFSRAFKDHVGVSPARWRSSTAPSASARRPELA
jgi:AraC-like DNA-binding protein